MNKHTYSPLAYRRGQPRRLGATRRPGRERKEVDHGVRDKERSAGKQAFGSNLTTEMVAVQISGSWMMEMVAVRV